MSSGAQVLPTVVMATPAMLINTVIIFVILMESWFITTPKKSVKRPDVELRTVVLTTLVFASARFDRYCMHVQSIPATSWTS